MLLKDTDEKANSVDPNQTAPRSSLIWVSTVCSDLSVPIFWILRYHVYDNNSKDADI